MPHQASGRFDFKICYPPKNHHKLDWRSGEMNLFGVFSQPKLDSVPITTDHFGYAKTLISNDDSRNIKVGPISESSRFSKQNSL